MKKSNFGGISEKSFYTLLIEGILVLSIGVQRIEILICDPRFLADIWSARNSKTFELCLSVRPSVIIHWSFGSHCCFIFKGTDAKNFNCSGHTAQLYYNLEICIKPIEKTCYFNICFYLKTRHEKLMHQRLEKRIKGKLSKNLPSTLPHSKTVRRNKVAHCCNLWVLLARINLRRSRRAEDDAVDDDDDDNDVELEMNCNIMLLLVLLEVLRDMLTAFAL